MCPPHYNEFKDITNLPPHFVLEQCSTLSGGPRVARSGRAAVEGCGARARLALSYILSKVEGVAEGAASFDCAAKNAAPLTLRVLS